MNNSNKKMFRGDGESLVDALVDACHQHKTLAPLPGAGRNLTPFFAPGEPLGPLPNETTDDDDNAIRRHNMMAPNKSKSMGSYRVLPSAAPASVFGFPSSGSPPGSVSLGSSPPDNTRGSSHLQRNPLQKPKQQQQQNQNQQRTRSTAGASSAALGGVSSGGGGGFSSPLGGSGGGAAMVVAGCPGFFTSPKPEALPMPSLKLRTASSTVAAAAAGVVVVV